MRCPERARSHRVNNYLIVYLMEISYIWIDNFQKDTTMFESILENMHPQLLATLMFIFGVACGLLLMYSVWYWIGGDTYRTQSRLILSVLSLILCIIFANRLHIAEEEVENYVCKKVGLKVIDAKIQNASSMFSTTSTMKHNGFVVRYAIVDSTMFLLGTRLH